jgi:hypothetical protein
VDLFFFLKGLGRFGEESFMALFALSFMISHGCKKMIEGKRSKKTHSCFSCRKHHNRYLPEKQGIAPADHHSRYRKEELRPKTCLY